VPKTPGKGYFALGKVFVGCSTRQRATGKKSVGKDFFIGHLAKTLPSANPAPGKEKWPSRRQLRQPLLCQVPCQRHPTKIFYFFFSNFFCRVPCRGGTRQIFFIFFYNFFAGCRAAGAPGKEFFLFFSYFLCRVSYQGGTQQRIFLKKSLLGALALTLGKAGPGHPAKPLFFIL
jgi:hypothetical protein